MPISMEQLAAALEPVRQVGTDEVSFPVAGTEVTLRLVTPQEEVEAHEYARDALDGDDPAAQPPSDGEGDCGPFRVQEPQGGH